MFKRNKPGKSKDDPKKLWEAYLKASLKQDWNKARDVLKDIIKVEPNNSKTHLKMGDLLQKLGDSKEAIKSYHRSASILVQSGFGQKALALYKIILRLDPKDKEALAGTRQIAGSPKPAGPSLPALASEKPASPPQPVESVPPPEELPAPEYVPAPEDIPPSEKMPPPRDLMAEEPEHGHMPPPAGWPDEGGAPSAWPGEEVSSTAQDEQDIPEFDLGTPTPQDEQDIPEFDLGIPTPQDEQAFPEFEMVTSESEVDDSLMELCIGPSEPSAEVLSQDTVAETSRIHGIEPTEWTGTLPEIFWSLNKEELTQIFNDSAIAAYTKGQTIVNEGDEGDSIFAIMEGSASVQANISGKSVELASLKAGDVFGEVAFLTGKPRTATVIANNDMRVMDISRAVLEKAIEKHPRILSCLAEYYHSRLNDTITKVKKARMPKVRLIVRE